MNKPHIRRGRRVPPLNPLRAFEAAARHLSFTNAADELAAKALAILEERKITSLVVVDAEEHVEGVVHLHDLWGVELI